MTYHARTNHLLVESIGDELLVYDRLNHHAHRLNRTAALVWRHCEGKRDPREIAAELGATLGCTLDPRAVTAALDDLAGAGLMEQAPAGPRVSRAHVVRALKAAAVGAALPAVVTIVAPAPAEADSPTAQPAKKTIDLRGKEAFVLGVTPATGPGLVGGITAFTGFPGSTPPVLVTVHIPPDADIELNAENCQNLLKMMQDALDRMMTGGLAASQMQIQSQRDAIQSVKDQCKGVH
ncbi:MAG TPA: PqqD family protein [Candidatus Elarobacter sp.]|nr:PqqD family protein [Candidatus Elarobacter sp.]